MLTEIMRQVWPHLIRAGVKTATVRYSGSGDSGSWDGVEFDPEIPKEVKAVIVSVPEIFSRWENGSWVKGRHIAEVSLIDAIERAADEVVGFRHRGWENNEGAEGSVVFDVDQMSLTNDHRQFFQTHEDYCNTYEVPLDPLAEMALRTATDT